MSGASAADMRSILSIPDPSVTQTPGASTSTPTTATKRKGPKPDGISRELYALIGSSAPTLTAQMSKPKYKPKPKNFAGGGRAAKWEWREFSNPARSDNLKLSHWVKATMDPNTEYPFAKYNVLPQSYTYSYDEYTNLLDEPGWTKEETDYLFSIVQEYDLRFYVIADRYNYPGGPPRTIEDIKDRYYGICKKLIRSRPWPGDDASKSQAVASVSYDKEREIKRKNYLASLESRTTEEIAEEEALFIELKRLEQTERNFARDRNELLRVFAGVESGLPGVAAQSVADEEEFALMMGDGKSTTRKRKNTMDVDSPVSLNPGYSAAAPQTPVRKSQSSKNSAQDALHCIHRTEVPQNATTTKAAHHPVYLRSYKIPAPRNAAAQRVAQVLGELGIRHERLVMPTRGNCQLLEQLLDAANALLDIKKVYDKVDQDIRVLQERLAERERQEEGGEGEGEITMEVLREGGDEVVDGIDVNANDDDPDADADADVDADADADADGETDRGVSQAPSARSSNDKLKSKRSASISSMASNSTSTTKISSRKRQRS